MKDIEPADYEVIVWISQENNQPFQNVVFHSAKEWDDLYQRASTSLQNRQEKMSHAADLIERNLVLLGVTAVEDKLQHGVSCFFHEFVTLEENWSEGTSAWLVGIGFTEDVVQRVAATMISKF